MLDLGQQATERIYADVQRRLKSNYRQAVHEVQAKLDDFTKRHKAADLKMRKKLADGLITKEEYRAWQRGQVYQGDLWRKQVNNLTETLYSSDVIAQRIVNEQRLNVFASNANAMAYSMEHGEGLDFGFGYYDSATVARLLKDQPNLLPPRTVKRKEDVEWYHKIVNNCVTQGILQGEGIPAIAKRIAETTGERSYNAAVRNARTAMTSAQNAGRIEVMHEAERMGIKVKKRWLATLDDRTRDAHADLDGQVQEVDDYFESSLGPILFPGDPSAEPANVYNCFVGETNVATDSNIIRSYKHDYSGKLITVKTACGVEFTCTPNHPILTPGGWVAAKCLNNGDNLLIASIGEVYPLRVNPNVDHTLSRIDAIHKFFDITGSKRTVSLGVNFHGDVPTSDVEVITQKRFLRDNGNTGCADSVDKFLLKHSDKSLMGKSAFMQHFGRVRLASLRLICGFGKALAFFGCSLAHTVIHGFGAVARRDTTVFEPQADAVTSNVQFLCDGLDGLSGKVFLDDIVNINITTVSHIPVYNLQTGNNRYFVNSIITQNGEKCNGNFAIAHNCRCTLIYEHPEYPSNFERRDNIDGEIIEDMTYREWESWKQGEAKKKTTREPAVVFRTLSQGDIKTVFGERPDRALRRTDREEYDRQREAYKQSAFGSWNDGLDNNEQGSIGDYSSDTYSAINGYCRGEMTEKMVRRWDISAKLPVEQEIGYIEKAISKFELQENIKVYRTCEQDVLQAIGNVGDAFKDNGFVSTTIFDKSVASGTVDIVIDVPKGVGRGAWIQPLSGSPDEYEFLLQRGSVFEVSKITETNGRTKIEMTWVGADADEPRYATREQVIERWKRLGLYDEIAAKEI